MTLSIGNHLVKLNHEGKPIMGDNATDEVYVEYEVMELGSAQQPSGTDSAEYGSRVLAVLKKVR